VSITEISPGHESAQPLSTNTSWASCGARGGAARNINRVSNRADLEATGYTVFVPREKPPVLRW
jgi:hypothetical protein